MTTAEDGPAVSTDIKSTETARKKKLYGRAFYESIGSPKRIVAPMVDASELAWRLLSRKYNADAAYSPMFHARMFAEMPSYRSQCLLPPSPANAPHPRASFDGDTKTDRPLIIQFCANDPEYLLQAAKYAQAHCDAVDLNLGCPQGIAKKGNYGSFLQEQPDLIYNLINKLHLELDIPVTAKIRVLETKEKTLEYAKMVLKAGASILTVHGRERHQKGHNTGLADWSIIKYLRDNLPPETVLFANGNILYNTDVDICLEATGADGIMSAEGNLHNPAIFMPPDAPYTERFPRIDHVCRDYFNIVKSVVFGMGVQNADTSQLTNSHQHASLSALKSHMFKLLHAVFQCKEHHYIRDILARSSAKNFGEYETVVEEVEKVVTAQLARTPETDENWQTIMEGSGKVGAEVKKLAIPWWRCQPYMRPSPAEARKKGALSDSKKPKLEKDNKRVLDTDLSEITAQEPTTKKLRAAEETTLIKNNDHDGELDIKVAG